MKASLSFTEAVGSWVGRALGYKKRDLCAKFDVDPRRLYEVWEEQVHPGSRQIAERLCLLLFRSKFEAQDFEPHRPRYKRTAIDQLELF